MRFFYTNFPSGRLHSLAEHRDEIGALSLVEPAADLAALSVISSRPTLPKHPNRTHRQGSPAESRWFSGPIEKS
jgi:hypothetical protein